jgi:hypothetical protein
MTRARALGCIVLALSTLEPALTVSGTVGAQAIPLRTVPVASGDQFLLLPSSTTSMGGVHVAVDDSLGDAWSNPAKGALLSGSAFLGSPTFYSISEQGGGGRSFPVAGVASGSGWFGGMALAIQEIENLETRSPWANVAWDVCCWGCCGGQEPTLGDRYGRNVYAQAFTGRRLGGGWSLGVGGSIARLGAMDGVDLLYAGSERIDESGRVSDVRVGAFHGEGRDRLSLVAFHSRLAMKHEVTWNEWVWDPSMTIGSFQQRVEVNEDQTRTWGGRLEWDRALSAPGWRVGASGTLNYKDHPKIPNYRIQNIPRDPGTTWAYEGAFGAAHTDGPTSYAVEVALQPIWSETWQEADAVDAAASGGRLGVGDRSIENDFFFTNAILRTGFSHDLGSLGLQAGVEVRAYAYQLEQVDHVRSTYREETEEWTEWTPTFGAVVPLEALELRYALRVTTGTGRPGTAWTGPALESLSAGGLPQADFLIAAEGPLTLQDVRVTTHQLSVRIPIR